MSKNPKLPVSDKTETIINQARPSDKNGYDSNSVAGQKSRSLRKKILTILGLIIVVSVLGALVYSSVERSKDQKLSNNFDDFVSSETDCNKFLNKFSNSSASDPLVQAKLLEARINCTKNTGQYDQTLEYINQLATIYSENKSLYHYVNIEYEKNNVIELKSKAKSEKIKDQQEKTQDASTKKAGSYAGP